MGSVGRDRFVSNPTIGHAWCTRSFTVDREGEIDGVLLLIGGDQKP